MPSFDGRGLRLDLKLDRGADYDFVIRWQEGLDLTGWGSWDGQISCSGSADVALTIDSSLQDSDGFVIVSFDHSTTAPCARKGETWGVTVADPNGLRTPMLYGNVEFFTKVTPDA